MSKSKAQQHINNFQQAVSDVLSGKKSPAQAAKAVKQSYKENVTDANDNAANNDKGESAMTTTTKETPKKSSATSSKSAPAAKKEETKQQGKGPQDLKREDIIAAASDMNDKMGLDPAINVKLATQAIGRAILENAAELDATDFDGSKAADEQISDATIATLEALGYKKPAPAKADPPKKTTPAAAKGKGEKKNDTPAATSGAKVKSASQMKADRAAAKANKAPAAPKYTRTNAFIDAIKAKCKKKGSNFDGILASVNELYAKHGHDEASTNDNAKKSRLLMVLESLVAFDVLTLKDGIYTFNE